MKRRILLISLMMMCLIGCGNQPRTYGNSINYSSYDTEDYHVVYAFSADGCYSDGSFESNQMYDKWLEKYEITH